MDTSNTHIKSVGGVIYEGGAYTVEAYATLFNAHPVALIVTDERRAPFKVGSIDSNFRFRLLEEHPTRTDAYRHFAGLCQAWVDKI